jgi:hypothetical protein
MPRNADSRAMSVHVDRLAAVRLSSLSRDDGTLMPAIGVTVVSLQHQLRFDSAFGRLASGPLSALYLPAGFRVRLGQGEDARGVFALSTMDAADARTRTDLLPSRVPIPGNVFAVLLECERDVPWVREAGADAPLGAVLAWLREHAAQRGARCAGRLVSRVALKDWIGEVTASEDALIGLPAALHERDFRLPAPLAEAASVRRFSRVTGYGPRHYAREYHRRAALV